jgi:hypothetical protein
LDVGGSPDAPAVWLMASCGTRAASWALVAVAVPLVVLGALTGFLAAPAQPPGSPQGVHALGRTIVLAGTVTDGGSLEASFNGTVANITDHVTDGSSNLTTRSYLIQLATDRSEPGCSLRVETHPMTDWQFADQFPWGADNLPALSYWNYSVLEAGQVVTSNWTIGPGNDTVTGVVPWLNATFDFVGTTRPVVPVAVNLNATTPTNTPGVSFVLNDPNSTGAFPSNDPTYPSLAGSLRPHLIRYGLTSAGTDASWGASGLPRFNFTGFDAAAELAARVGAPVLLTLPVGTWGDGNLLPAGMPLNLSVAINHSGSIGYLPTGSAYATFVGAVVNHTLAANESIAYWNVGNEMPLVNASVVSGYIELFNVAEEVIHDAYPSAAVGSDVMMNATYLPTFAAAAHHVGFLSFHYYPGAGLCIANGSYCPPARGAGTPTPALFQPVSSLEERSFLPPSQAQREWFNLTGHWVPVFDSETNLNGVGGSASTAAMGTDPRQQTLIGAAWIGYSLIQAASENMTTVTYFTLTGPNTVPPSLTADLGGWGFGMTREAPDGGQIKFAPYWALELWAQNLPSGRPGVSSSSADTSVIQVYAATNGTNLSVLVVSLVNVTVRVPVEVDPAVTTATSCQVLDGNSYQEFYDGATGQVILGADGVSSGPAISFGGVPGVELDGYGVAVLHFRLTTGGSVTSNTSGNESVDGTGSGGSGQSSPGGTTGSALGVPLGRGALRPLRVRSITPPFANGAVPAVASPPAIASWVAGHPGTISILLGGGIILAADLYIVRRVGRSGLRFPPPGLDHRESLGRRGRPRRAPRASTRSRPVSRGAP